MHDLPRSLFVGATLLAAAAAQTHVISPRGLDTVPGGNTTGYPWGYAATQQFRYQQIHDDMAGTPQVLLGMAVRRKETGAAYPAISPTLQVDLSTAAVGSQSATSTFATNHGADRTVVMAARQVNFPAVNPPAAGFTAPFTYVLMFDAPWFFGGQGSLCWEVLMTANNYLSGATLNLDLAQNNLARNQAYGQTCGGTLTGSYAAPFLNQTLAGVAPNSLAILALGYDNRSYFSVPLPLDLTGAGAPGCALYMAPVLFVTAPTSASGTARFALDVSSLPLSAVIHSQALVPDTSNALGLVFSNGLYATPQMARTFMRNWTSNTAAATGSLQLIYTLVTDFIEP